jgi:DNA-binding response OmpR family regulator
MTEQSVILIIEDDLELGRLVEEILQYNGYATLLLPDGYQAVEWLQNQTPSIIFLDLHLPGISGLKILENIRSSERLKDIAVYIMTANIILAKLASKKADGVLSKPFKIDEILKIAGAHVPS